MEGDRYLSPLGASAINARPFSGSGDPDAYPAKVEVQL